MYHTQGDATGRNKQINIKRDKVHKCSLVVSAHFWQIYRYFLYLSFTSCNTL